jgi:hypothetical protein
VTSLSSRHEVAVCFRQRNVSSERAKYIGVPANNTIGVTTVAMMEPATGKISRQFRYHAGLGGSNIACELPLK